jgi:4-hydroxy-4-methyl-2-oxoglutarate aldolase
VRVWIGVVELTVLSRELIAQYQRLDGASVSNAVERFGVRLRNEGFADGSVRCLTRGLPPVVGHAVTARIRCSSPPAVGHRYHDRTDWWNFIASVPTPRIVVVQDVDERPGFGAFVGDVHAAILTALDCVAFVTNGAVRDVGVARETGFRLFASHAAISHAFAHILDFGGPVEIAGLPIATGDLLFGDDAGVLSLPASIAEQVPRAAEDIRTKEEQVIAFCRSERFSIDGLRELVRDLE